MTNQMLFTPTQVSYPSVSANAMVWRLESQPKWPKGRWTNVQKLPSWFQGIHLALTWYQSNFSPSTLSFCFCLIFERVEVLVQGLSPFTSNSLDTCILSYPQNSVHRCVQLPLWIPGTPVWCWTDNPLLLGRCSHSHPGIVWNRYSGARSIRICFQLIPSHCAGFAYGIFCIVELFELCGILASQFHCNSWTHVVTTGTTGTGWL